MRLYQASMTKDSFKHRSTDSVQIDPALLAVIAHRQSIVSWSFASMGLAMFSVYVLLNVLARPTLVLPVAATSSFTLAIALGFGMLLATMLLTAAYVLVTARYVTPLVELLRRQ